jgi:uncharacterized membrane protein YcjF (UPF0283 family)
MSARAGLLRRGPHEDPERETAEQSIRRLGSETAEETSVRLGLKAAKQRRRRFTLKAVGGAIAVAFLFMVHGLEGGRGVWELYRAEGWIGSALIAAVAIGVGIASRRGRRQDHDW